MLGSRLQPALAPTEVGPPPSWAGIQRQLGRISQAGTRMLKVILLVGL